jgi:ribosomal protein S18 acetylase RimI-like enzyme
MVALREATREDADALARVHIDSWRSAYAGLLPSELLAALDVTKRADAWRTILSDASGTAYLALEAQEVLAFVHVCPSRDEHESLRKTGEITSIYVAPQAWGKGLGTKLLHRGLHRLVESGYGEATVWVLEGNHRACRFYERQNFLRDGATKMHSSSGLTEVRYRRGLTSEGSANPASQPTPTSGRG